MHEKSESYFAKKATMEKVSCKAHKSNTKHKESIYKDGGEYRKTQEDEMVENPTDGDSDEDILLKELVIGICLQKKMMAVGKSLRRMGTLYTNSSRKDRGKTKHKTMPRGKKKSKECTESKHVSMTRVKI